MLHYDSIIFWLSQLHSQNQSVTGEIKKIKIFCYDALSHDTKRVEIRI